MTVLVLAAVKLGERLGDITAIEGAGLALSAVTVGTLGVTEWLGGGLSCRQGVWVMGAGGCE